MKEIESNRTGRFPAVAILHIGYSISAITQLHGGRRMFLFLTLSLPCSDKVAHTFMVMGALFFLCTSHSPPTLNTRVVQPGTAHDGMFRSKELRPLLSPPLLGFRDDKSIDSS